jgi:hypothetical protein
VAQASSKLFHHMRREMRVLLNEKMESLLIDWRQSAGGLRHSRIHKWCLVDKPSL